MNVLLISEHYYPKIGGTVSYVDNISKTLAEKKINTFLLVPAHGSGDINIVKQSEFLTILEVPVSEKIENIFSSSNREVFCLFIKTNILRIVEEYKIEIVHLLNGLFIANILDTKSLKNKKIKTFHTIHNIPPLECSNSWKGDSFFNFLKDRIRKIGVKYVNKKRIQKNVFDYYITPSAIVKNDLEKILKHKKIEAIGHGGAEFINTPIKSKNDTGKTQILTVGGIVPHKNQLFIPLIANYLQLNNYEFEWTIIGPVRNERYYKALLNDIKKYNLENLISVKSNLSDEELRDNYIKSDFYIQLSSEEGFCMTVLDAIAYNIPTIGTPAGAIPEMLSVVDGILIENEIETLKTQILHYLKIRSSLSINNQYYSSFKEKYTWENSINQLLKLYNE